MNYKEEKFIDSDGQELTKKTFDDGSIWYTNEQGSFNRLDGPAFVSSNGEEIWYKDGKIHRLDGPAWIWSNGTEEWYLNGKLHRLDAPACIWPDGKEDYYLEGKPVSKREIDLIWLKKQVEE